jgi:chromosome segregation ATPase
MPEIIERSGTLLAATALVAVLALSGAAPAASGTIVCWKDKSGRVVGCGDKVPPEFQGSATKELDSHGVTRKQTESVEEANRRREKEQALAQQKAQEERKALEQKRQDTALLESFSNEKEIDLKRDRDLQVIDFQIEQLEGALKNAGQRYTEAKGRASSLEKNKRPLPATLKEELTRVTQEKERSERSIEAKKKEKDELRVKYADFRKRYTDLRAQQASSRR